MQKIATRIFTYASVVFGVLGISLVLSIDPESEPNVLLMKSLFGTAFVTLTSFALSVASKYLSK